MKGALCFVAVALLHFTAGQGPCDDATLSRGILYSYTSSIQPNADCSKYRQCHRNPANSASNIIVYKACPYGLYWNQASFSCERSNSFTCPIRFASCNVDRRMAGEGCRSYWRCQGNREEAACCAAGTRFSGTSCVPDLTCLDPCPGPCGVNEVCQSLPDWERPGYYYYNDPATNQQVERICPSGTHYDALQCGCVTAASTTPACQPEYRLQMNNNAIIGVSNWLQTDMTPTNGELFFTENNRQFVTNFDIETPTLTRPLVLTFSYREVSNNIGSRELLKTDDCKNCNKMRIDLIGSEMVVTLTKRDREVARVAVELLQPQAESYKDVVVMYNGKELILIVRYNGNFHMQRGEAPKLDILSCGLTMGSSTNFVGYLRNFQISRCTPTGRSMDFIPFA